MAYESPSFVVVERIGRVEIRDYDGYLAAETDVDGPLEQAGNAGFRTLARFIFGANQVSPGQSTKIAMTSPVTQVPADDRFRVRFMMPTKYTAESLPVPDDPRVTIVEVGPQRLAAIRYSGRWSQDGHDRHLEELREVLAANDRSTVGEPIWARYDPPWKPWFLRRNEVLVELDEPPSEHPQP
jgi:hypothetical protein